MATALARSDGQTAQGSGCSRLTRRAAFPEPSSYFTDRTYIGRIVEIAARYGRDQLLAIAVPIDQIQRPIIELRNQTLFYSIAILVFVLPLYVTLIVAWLIEGLAAAVRRYGRSRVNSGS